MEVGWTDPKTRAAQANAALTLQFGELDEPLQTAFDAFRLDPRNPWDWRRLIWELAYSHPRFASRAGRPAKDLRPLVSLLTRDGNWKRSNAELVTDVKKLGWYRRLKRNLKTATIEKYLREARRELSRIIEEQVEERLRPPD